MKLFFTITSLVLGLSLAAQTKSDPEAKRMLDAVSAKFKTYKAPQATFTYTVENAQGKALSSKRGTVTMKGNRYRVIMDGMDIYSDGRTTWNYDGSTNEVTVDNVNTSGSAMTPQKLFTNFYDKDFYYKFNGDKKMGGKNVREIELTPIDKTRPYHKVYVWIDKATNTIHSARFMEKSGGRYTYTINALKPTATVADTYFVFNKSRYPGVEVVDLR